jgi:hypothetical protein
MVQLTTSGMGLALLQAAVEQELCGRSIVTRFKAGLESAAAQLLNRKPGIYVDEWLSGE